MNTHNISIAVLLLSVQCIFSDDFSVLDSIEQESPCINSGGMCTIAADCAEKEDISKRGLCPKQAAQGIDCCYGGSVKETRCKKNGGECWNKSVFCGLQFERATDCRKDEHCCILS